MKTRDELLKKKKTLEKGINELCREFEKETGLRIGEFVITRGNINNENNVFAIGVNASL
jgi:hypothetical protein